MKKIILLISLCLVLSQAYAQKEVPDEVLQKLQKNQEQTKANNPPHIPGPNETSTEAKTPEEETNGKTENANHHKGRKDEHNKLNQSKNDFVAGDQYLFYDDFSSQNPDEDMRVLKSNSNCEISKNASEHYLQINSGGLCSPDLKTDLTENYTIEFEIALRNDNGKSTDCNATVYIANTTAKSKNEALLGAFGYKFVFEKGEFNVISYLNNKALFTKKIAAKLELGNSYKIAISLRDKRFKVFVDNDKVLDTNRILPEGSIPNDIIFAASKNAVVKLSNMIISTFTKEIRDKIFGEGRFIIYNIRFDAQSVAISPENFPALTELADVLKENPGERIRLVCYCDENGEAEKNIELTKQRAENIKRFMVKNCKINESLITAEGRGSNEPIGQNESSEGRAKNRRIEIFHDRR